MSTPAPAPSRAPVLLAGGLLGALSLPALAALVAAALLAAVLPFGAGSVDRQQGVSQAALADIPPRYLALYLAAARRYGLDWAILAGIGKVECDHGRDPAPSCTHEGVENTAGAGGPAQFLASTWAQYGVDGDGDGRRDRWDPADAIASMANYLRASGAPADLRGAIFAYNHSESYVALVLDWAARYRAAQASPSAGPLTFASQATLDPGDGHLALAPADAPLAVRAMIAGANELQALPYGPAGHPDPRNAASEDCSSTVNYVLWRGGVRSIAEILATNPLAQDYPSWGSPGPGRWVTIYATTVPVDHVFIVLAGLRLDTSHRGTDVGPNRDQDGPRWRILDHIPTWAPWVIRHPPGL